MMNHNKTKNFSILMREKPQQRKTQTVYHKHFPKLLKKPNKHEIIFSKNNPKKIFEQAFSIHRRFASDFIQTFPQSLAN
jgi:hypothetical protein